ncbi:hypothetical protein K466DRAFT_598996 [Polyporus arcularius HHB13444]|uniref:Uncharacterized protein n=1 Tax=Polyporus arcularius HHB13444 TaxID=1314778 RepID=A0A5C3PEK2_9APHY|nr:hypothetical protein K466DRAFT_598996 [Polyporus arcularius HHB13444]
MPFNMCVFDNGNFPGQTPQTNIVYSTPLHTMLFTFVTLALALLSAVQATPVASGTTVHPVVDSVSADGTLPVVGLALGSAGVHGNVTVGTSGVHGDSVNAVYPATIFLCRSTGCGSCTGFDLSIQPHQTCLTGGFNYVSAFINQPSNQGLPFAVYTGPSGCGSFAQVPVVNTCYNANYVGWDFELLP